MSGQELDGATNVGDYAAWPSNAGEFAARWNARDPEDREARARRIIEDAQTAGNCWQADHAGRIEGLTARAERAEARERGLVDQVNMFQRERDTAREAQDFWRQRAAEFEAEIEHLHRFEWLKDKQDAIARAERAERKSAELAAVIAEIQRRLRLHFFQTEEFDSDDLGEIVFAVPADVLREHDERVKAEAIAGRDNLRAAYDAIKTEYAEYRKDRQDQMTRIRAALDDAYRGARTGNLVTPHWVVQSIDDARAAGGWTIAPQIEGSKTDA